MPIPHISGKKINLECNTPFVPEFNDLLTGIDDSTEIIYFDATNYIETQGKEGKSVDHFLFTCSIFWRGVIDSFKLEPDETLRENQQGHILINAQLAFLFLSYMDPSLLGYIFMKMQAMLIDGVVFSESYIAAQAQMLLSKTQIQSLADSLEDEDGEGAGSE